MRTLLALSTLPFLVACPAPGTRCEADAGAPDQEVQLRLVNLGRDPVTLRLEGEDAGTTVPALGAVAKVGHVTLLKLRGTVEGTTLLPDGGVELVSLPLELDPSDGAPATFVVRDSTPARISTNLTVGRQTQGTTFGEKVSAGLAALELEGGVDTDGDCLTDYGAPTGTPARTVLATEPPSRDCDDTAEQVFVRPAEVDAEATPSFVRTADGWVQVAWVPAARKGGAVGKGASLLGGALPGGAVLSAALSSVFVLNVHGGQATASVSIDGVEVAHEVAPGSLVRVKSGVLAQALRRSVDPSGHRHGAVASVAVGATTGAVELGVLGDDDVLLVVSEALDSSATVMKSRHETGKNAVGNVRRTIAFGTTLVGDTKACVAVAPSDDACVMGAAAVSAVGTSGGGASSAAYAATGRLLYPPKAPPAQGTTMRFGVEELAAVTRQFLWESPPGLTPTAGRRPQGFAIVATGLALDPGAVDRRALFFVDTSVTPWSVQASLSQ